MKMSKFRRLTKAENFKFIVMVQAYPPLYGGKLTEYKDKELTANIYDKIASEIGIEGITGMILFVRLFDQNIEIAKNKPLAGEQ